jgi:nitrite reductase/ring-hydroxylating ferredoxin subunit
MGSPMAVGDRVIVDGMAGEVSFLGEDLPDLPAGSWVGVVYDEPVGKNDGTVKGRRLFKCKKNHGHLVRPEKVKVCFAETALKRQAMGMMGPSVGHAARSHEANDRYMENFENAYAMLQGGDPSSLYAGRAGAGSSHGCGGRDGDPRRLLVQEIPGSGGVSPVRSRMVGKSGAASASGHCEVSQIGSQLETMSLLGTQSSWWSKGPSDPKGTEIDVSDRPNTCISIRGNEAVIGSTDHALYAIDIHKGVKTRTLYSKACGHTEWVTCVTHLSDGRVVSGGMDGKLCLWNAAGARCSDLKGHTGSITAVRANKASGVLVSASYDATLAIWDSCRHPSRALSSTLRGHKVAPCACVCACMRASVTGVTIR